MEVNPSLILLASDKVGQDLNSWVWPCIPFITGSQTSSEKTKNDCIYFPFRCQHLKDVSRFHIQYLSHTFIQRVFG